MLIFDKKFLKKKYYIIKNKKYTLRKIKKCEICNSNRLILFQNVGKIGDNPGIYGYLPVTICRDCTLKFLSPRPSNIYYKKFFNLDYGKTYFGKKDVPSKHHLKFQADRGKRIFNFLKNQINKEEKILDHGCSTGLTMIPWIQNRYKIEGLDPHLPSVNYGKKNYNLKIKHGFGEKLPFSKASFNLVISLGSLEHCFNIQKSLNEINRILKYNGQLFIRWRSDKLIGSPLEYFGHNTLRFMNKRSWIYILEKNNFEIKNFINKKIEGYDSFEYILVKKKKYIKKFYIRKSISNEYYSFEKHIKKYHNLCLKVKKLKKINFINKINFIKRNKIGLMNIGKKKSINRFFKETIFFLKFIKNITKSNKSNII